VTSWASDAIFYHIFPLGLCGAPRKNEPSCQPQHRLEKLLPWLDHAREMGATAILLGPVMEAGTHGYDVIDYFSVDRRLGEQSTLTHIAEEVHRRGMRLVLDGVFHHVGRDFPAFRDVRENGRSSRFTDWFHLDFSDTSPCNDPFSYKSWNGCHDLVKLNLQNPEVRQHLFDAVSSWIREYHIDGLRLDAADHLDMGFMNDLADLCRRLKADFWLMGEVVKGPYSQWLLEGGLDSVTNYECYKGFYSSHNDGNYFEIAHTLRHHFGKDGIYRSAGLYSFVDNHDVERVVTRLDNPAHLYPLYCLLFTVPGIPAIYYGSEFGTEGAKSARDDWSLRPVLDLHQLCGSRSRSDLVHVISRLAHLRAQMPALRHGDFQQLFLSQRRFIFSRRSPDQWVIVAVSAEKEPLEQNVTLPEPISGRLVDRLNPGQQFDIREGKAHLNPLWPCWARVMEVQIGT
jgi:cyclomaltodextrinase / maltogenic alpha-amylase / neopullulanase